MFGLNVRQFRDKLPARVINDGYRAGLCRPEILRKSGLSLILGKNGVSRSEWAAILGSAGCLI